MSLSSARVLATSVTSISDVMSHSASGFTAAVPRSPGRRLLSPSPPVSPSYSNAPRRIPTPRKRALAESGGPFPQFNSNDLMASGSRPAQGSTRRTQSAQARQGADGSTWERPLKVGDLDQTEQAASWVKKPLYYTHHRKGKQEQLSQVIRLPPMHRNVQFTASEGASWDRIADNALQAAQKCPGKRLSMVVLLYCGPCNPFHLGDMDVLKRARVSLDALTDVAVVGALVVPLSEETLKERGTSEDRKLPFSLRRDLTRTVLSTALQDDWVVVDTCLGTASDQARTEGCMQHIAGSIAPFVSVYARGRLHGRQHDIRVVEVRSEDPIEGSRTGCPYDQLHVSPGKYATTPRHGPGDGKPGLASVGTLVVDVPKQTQCDDLIWSAVKQPQDRQLFQAMERFCSAAGARMISDWSQHKSTTRHRKSKLLGI